MNPSDEKQDGSSRGHDGAIDLAKLTAEVTANYLARNPVAPSELPTLIQTIHGTLETLGKNADRLPENARKPAVPVRRSVQPDYIICLEDGRKLQMLKRHLRTQYNMTPDEYRAKWNLPRDYPMVAPNYSKKRSRFAKSIGLGTTATRSGSTEK